MNSRTFQKIIDRHRLTFAITAVIGIALVMTSISMSLYITSGTSSLDLSRPGYSQAREQLNASKGVTFSESGPLDQQVMTDFETLFDSQQNAINELDGFGGAVLDDPSLQLQ